MSTLEWLAVVIVGLQTVCIWVGLLVVRTFGRYSIDIQQAKDAVIYAHDTNMIVHEQSIKMLREIQKRPHCPKEKSA